MSRSSCTFLLLVMAVVLALMCQVVTTQEAGKEPTTTPSTKLIVYHQLDGQYIKRGEIVGLPGVPEYIPSSNEIVDFKNPEDKFYQIKVKDERTNKILLTSVLMCQMVASNWNDEFNLHLDQDNQFYYLSYYAGSNDCQQNLKYPITTSHFTTDIRVSKPESGSMPLLGNFGAQKKNQQKSNKPTAKVNDEVPDANAEEEKSFFQKYWAYILAGGFMLVTIVGGATEPPQQQGGARR